MRYRPLTMGTMLLANCRVMYRKTNSDLNELKIRGVNMCWKPDTDLKEPQNGEKRRSTMVEILGPDGPHEGAEGAETDGEGEIQETPAQDPPGDRLVEEGKGATAAERGGETITIRDWGKIPFKVIKDQGDAVENQQARAEDGGEEKRQEEGLNDRFKVRITRHDSFSLARELIVTGYGFWNGYITLTDGRVTRFLKSDYVLDFEVEEMKLSDLTMTAEQYEIAARQKADAKENAERNSIISKVVEAINNADLFVSFEERPDHFALSQAIDLIRTKGFDLVLRDVPRQGYVKTYRITTKQ